MTQADIENGRTLAIICYFTFIGLIIAMVMNMEKKNPFISFHIRQMLGLVIILIFSNLVEKYVNSWLGTGFWFITFVSWVYGLYSAISGTAKPIPVIGELFQNWFENIGK